MWNLIEAIEARGGAAKHYLPGVLGVPLLLRGGASIVWSDLELFVLPGLTHVGIRGSLIPVQGSHMPKTGLLLRGQPTAVFGLNASLEPQVRNTSVPPTGQEETQSATESDIPDPVITSLHLAMQRPGSKTVYWKCEPGAEWTETSPELEFAAAMPLKRYVGVGRRNFAALLLRWCAFAAANPERLITPEDVEACTNCSAFLSAAEGTRKSPFATRVRRAANAFAGGDVDGAFCHLTEGVLLAIHAPLAVRTALLASDREVLSDMQRRDLIYMSRSGPWELKVLAVSRLAAESHRYDARSTRRQLRYDSNAWVRQAATDESRPSR